MTRRYTDIPLFRDVSEDDWNDYRWQLRHRLRTTEDFAQVLNLSEQQREDLDACMGKFRVSVTPYYASLMDPNDPKCPVRMQAVPSRAELDIRHEDQHDAVGEDLDSPTPRITHRYPDRVLLLVTEMCSMYCRHCTRRRLVGRTEAAVKRTEMDNAISYIERSPEVRDVLLSGGDPLVLADEYLDELLGRIHAIPHVEIIRLGTRAPVVFPQRITPQLVSMLKKYQPLYINTHFNHPKEFTPESRRALQKSHTFVIACAGILRYVLGEDAPSGGVIMTGAGTPENQPEERTVRDEATKPPEKEPWAVLLFIGIGTMVVLLAVGVPSPWSILFPVGLVIYSVLARLVVVATSPDRLQTVEVSEKCISGRTPRRSASRSWRRTLSTRGGSRSRTGSTGRCTTSSSTPPSTRS